MNRSHLEAFLWLRWRLAVNQFRRSGPGGVILSGILTVVVVVAAAGTVAVVTQASMLRAVSRSARFGELTNHVAAANVARNALSA